MKVLNRSTCVLLAVFSWFSLASASAAAPRSGFYENASDSPLVDLIDSAQEMLDIEIYQMSNPRVLDAILAAQDAGVKVRILQEPTPVGDACNVFEAPTTLDVKDCTVLKNFRRKVVAKGGIYRPFNKRLCGGATAGCVEHGKMVLVDAKVALLSTGNFNSTNLCDKRDGVQKCNRDYSYVLRHAPAIQVLGTIFEKDLEGKPYKLGPILARKGAMDLTVSPYSIEPLIGFIRSAKRSIILQQQYMKDPILNEELMRAAKMGVDVKIMVSSACYFGRPSPNDVKVWNAIYSKFEEAGAKIRTFTHRIPVGGLDGYLHAKAIVVDGRSAWVGSVNGSTQSLGSNREFGLFFDGPADVQDLLFFMQGDFKHPGGQSWQDSLVCKRDL